MYQVPNEYYFRLHHIRPRFKNDVENVLFFMANKLSQMNSMSTKEFKRIFNDEIRLFPGNSHKTEKTIRNWRTEICAIFGFVIEKDGYVTPGNRALELAEKQDLIEFFKTFLYNFQYPGSHLKPHEVVKMVTEGIKFKPAHYILGLLKDVDQIPDKERYLSKAEVCHLILNDLRCSRDCDEPKEVWKRIIYNRTNNIKYDWSGDMIRYAGDILDYMVLANLLKSYNGYEFWINQNEEIAIQNFIESNDEFKGYDPYIEQRKISLSEAKEQIIPWFTYVNRDMDGTNFSTDIIAIISQDEQQYEGMRKHALSLFDEKLQNGGISTKEIGDLGESLAHEHECNRLTLSGRDDLIHLIQLIPTQFAVGYDLQSIEINEQKRLIEVKSTISSKPLMFNSFHLTPNEWRAAESYKDRYYVYRLMLSKGQKKLFVIQDPVGKYKSDIISMIPKNNGVNINFNDSVAGEYKELLLNEKI